MAEGGANFDSFDDILSCIVCFEEFTSEGDYVPRLLPCTHTLCEKCMKALLLNDSLECPVCRKRHPAANGAENFPQNKVLLTVIRRKTTYDKKLIEDQKKPICQKHGRDITLFCIEPGCRVTICQLCLGTHRKHEMKDPKQEREERYQGLVVSADALKNNLQSNKQKFVETKQELEETLKACTTKLQNEKETKLAMFTDIITKRYDELLETMTNQWTREKRNIDADLATIDKAINEINEAVDNVDPNSVILEDVTEKLIGVGNISTRVKKTMAGTRSYNHFEYRDHKATAADVKKLCGGLIQYKTNLEVTEPAGLRLTDLNQVETPSQLKCSGTSFFRIKTRSSFYKILGSILNNILKASEQKRFHTYSSGTRD